MCSRVLTCNQTVSRVWHVSPRNQQASIVIKNGEENLWPRTEWPFQFKQKPFKLSCIPSSSLFNIVQSGSRNGKRETGKVGKWEKGGGLTRANQSHLQHQLQLIEGDINLLFGCTNKTRVYEQYVVYLDHQCKHVWLGEYEPRVGERERKKKKIEIQIQWDRDTGRKGWGANPLRDSHRQGGGWGQTDKWSDKPDID